MNNPFSMTFGMEPSNYIDRFVESEQIIDDFSSEEPSNCLYLFTGIRGAGKTVFMYSIAEKMRKKEDWIVANVGPKDNILEEIASEIYEQGKVKRLFLKGEFSFSFQGLAFSIKGEEPISSVMSLLKKMLVYLQKKGKKVLVTIDEVDNSEAMKLFVQGYASLLGQKLPMRLLMTGLYENVAELQNNKSLTFLYRAPRIQIGALPIIAIAGKYSELLKSDEKQSMVLAKLTKGYAYAYQVLGHILYEQGKRRVDQSALHIFDQRMAEYVYDKVYSEASPTEQEILKAIGSDMPIKLASLALRTGKSAKFLSAYRDKLIKKGIIVSTGYGHIQFALPRFATYLLSK